MNCYLCSRPFDSQRLIPKLLPKCGHTICLSCFQELTSTPSLTFNCPFDNLLYLKNSEFPDNQQFLELAKPKTTEKGLCHKHDKRLELFCKNCQETVCSDCALFDAHKKHTVEPLSLTKQRMELKIKGFRSKVGEFQKTINYKAQDLSVFLETMKREKTEEIENNFREIFDKLTAHKKHVGVQLSQFYDKVRSSLELIQDKIAEMDKKVSGPQIENELAQNPSKERFYEKEIEDIEQTINSKLMLSVKQQQALVALQFDRSLTKKMNTFCKMVCNSEAFNSEHKDQSERHSPEPEEDNLLHESFRDALRLATDSLIQDDGTTIQESFRHRNPLLCSPGPTSYISELKNYSPLSSISKKSGMSNIKNEGSMLRRKNTNGVQPLQTGDNFTQKKSLNNLEIEDSQNRKAGINSPIMARQTRLSDNSSVKSNNTFQQNTPSLFQFTEKENLTGSQANVHLGRTSSFPIDKINAFIDLQIKSKTDTLDLSGHGMTNKDLECILKRFSSFGQFSTLKLNKNQLTENSLKNILRQIKGLRIQFIFLTENNLNESSLDYFISFLKYNQSLKAIYLAGNPLIVPSPTLGKKVKLLENKNIMVVI